jgi:hypothetical protein
VLNKHTDGTDWERSTQTIRQKTPLRWLVQVLFPATAKRPEFYTFLKLHFLKNPTTPAHTSIISTILRTKNNFFQENAKMHEKKNAKNRANFLNTKNTKDTKKYKIKIPDHIGLGVFVRKLGNHP